MEKSNQIVVRSPFSPPMVGVRVGPSGRIFFLDGNRLRPHSQFFGNMPENKVFLNGEIRVFRLPAEYDAAVFSVFSEWLHHFPNPGLETGTIAKNNNTGAYILLKCYVLALQLQAPVFRDFILGEIQVFYCFRAVLTLDEIRYVYENTHETYDLLRRYCIWKMCAQVTINPTLAQEVFFELSIEGGPIMMDYFEACGVP